jgi:putative GTP pyrophosphokinase
MNFWATIEHSLQYKYSGEIPDEIEQRLVKAAEAAFQLDEEMSKIRGEVQEAQKIMTKKQEASRRKS